MAEANYKIINAEMFIANADSLNTGSNIYKIKMKTDILKTFAQKFFLSIWGVVLKETLYKYSNNTTALVTTKLKMLESVPSTAENEKFNNYINKERMNLRKKCAAMGTEASIIRTDNTSWRTFNENGDRQIWGF